MGSGTGGPEIVWLREVVGRPVAGPRGQHLGHVRDLVVRWRPEPQVTVLTGVVVDAGGHRFRVPSEVVDGWGARALTLTQTGVPEDDGGARSGGVDVRLAESVLGQPVLTTPITSRARRITDVGLRRNGGDREVWAVDTRSRWQRLFGRDRRLTAWSLLTRRRVGLDEVPGRPDVGGASG